MSIINRLGSRVEVKVRVRRAETVVTYGTVSSVAVGGCQGRASAKDAATLAAFWPHQAAVYFAANALNMAASIGIRQAYIPWGSAISVQ